MLKRRRRCLTWNAPPLHAATAIIRCDACCCVTWLRFCLVHPCPTDEYCPRSRATHGAHDADVARVSRLRDGLVCGWCNAWHYACLLHGTCSPRVYVSPCARERWHSTEHFVALTRLWARARWFYCSNRVVKCWLAGAQISLATRLR